MQCCTLASLILWCKQIPMKANDITTPTIPFAQQLSSVILLIFLHIFKGRKGFLVEKIEWIFIIIAFYFHM